MNDTSNKDRHLFLDLLTTAAGATLIVAGLLYAMGWSYLYQYYKSFGVGIGELNFPIYYSLIYSLPVLTEYWWVPTLCIVITSGVIAFLERWPLVLKVGGFVVLLMAVFSLAVILSKKALKMGESQARSDMLETAATLPSIAIKLDNDLVSPEKTSVSESSEEYDTFQFRLLIYANSKYYFFRPIKGDLSEGNLTIYVIPDSRIRGVRIQRGL